MAYDFSISSSVLANGRTAYSAQLNISAEAKFVIGYKTSYEGNFGLFTTSVTAGQVYIRSSNDRIANALNTNGDYQKAFANLCTIGSANYQSRITTVRNTIKSLQQQGLFSKKYDAKTGEFV